MNTDQLVELVRANLLFHDLNHPNYSDIRLKDDISKK